MNAFLSLIERQAIDGVWLRPCNQLIDQFTSKGRTVSLELEQIVRRGVVDMNASRHRHWHIGGAAYSLRHLLAHNVIFVGSQWDDARIAADRATAQALAGCGNNYSANVG